MALTILEIKNLKPKKKLYRVSDQKGLSIEITPSGGKLWRWRYRYNDKGQMMALGQYPEVSLADARERLMGLRRLLSEGKNPIRERKLAKLRSEQANENTFEAVARKWLDLKKPNLNAKYHQQTIARLEQHVFPVIGDLPIAELTIPDVVEVVEKIAERGTIETAKRMGQFISQTCHYAATRGLCAHNPASNLKGILPSSGDKHHNCVPLSDVPELLNDIDGYDGAPLVKYLMRLLSLTFVRTAEIIGAKWNEIDFDRAEWHIPAERMKMKRPHLVPLSSQAIELLNEIKAISGAREFVFYSSRSKSRHISNGAILMALKRMGYKGRMTGHGFRTIASTVLNEKGYNSDWIERQLAHKEKDAIRGAYNRAEYLLERKKMMQDYADILERMKTQPDNVIALNTDKAALND